MVRDWCKYVRIYEKVMVHILHYNAESFKNRIQNQPPIGVLWKSCCENMQQIYRRTPMQKCDFNKVALHFGMGVWVFSCKFLHIFRKTFAKNTSGRLLLQIAPIHKYFKHRQHSNVHLGLCQNLEWSYFS